MKDIYDFIGEKLSQILVKKEELICSPEDFILAEEIIFLFETTMIRILPLADTDELTVEYVDIVKEEKAEYFEALTLMPQYIGRKLSVVWNCVNTNGYSDMFIVGFDNLHPSLCIVSETSCLKLFEATQIKYNERA